MNPQVANALNTTNRLIPLVENAERQFKSARNWGIMDIFGGDSMLFDIIKHFKLHNAKGTMDEVNTLLQVLARQLGEISIPNDYRMQMGGFLTFADFVFDGILVDAYMISKIVSSLDQIRKLKEKLYILRDRLKEMNA